MGLNIRAFERLELVATRPTNGWADDDWDDDGSVILSPAHGFAEATDGVEATDGMVPGKYAIHGEQIHFRAGSYSGYNGWREWLAAQVGTTPRAVWSDPKPGPFVELINNSDCEGFIGPKTAAKLARDFQEHAGRIVGDDYEVQRYRDWQRAFELAANGGAVKFT